MQKHGRQKEHAYSARRLWDSVDNASGTKTPRLQCVCRMVCRSGRTDHSLVLTRRPTPRALSHAPLIKEPTCCSDPEMNNHMPISARLSDELGWGGAVPQEEP